MDATSGVGIQLWATVRPALALTGLALLYSSIYTNIALLAPYHPLTSKTEATANRSIATQYAGSTPLFAMLPSMRQDHVSTCVSAFAAMVEAFLTIVVSSQYYTQTIDTLVQVEV
jgi:hypothetical protein